MWQTIQRWARALKSRLVVLAVALKDPRTPWYARAVGGLTMLYALSPVDLIPDFIPVLGYLDDLLLVPLGIWLTVWLIPAEVWAASEAEAARLALGRPAKDGRGLVLVVCLWMMLIAALTAAVLWMRS